jgi:hypothetical protein
MKKTLIFAMILFSCSLLNTSLSAQSSSSTVLVSQSDRMSTGTITEITLNGVKAIDNTTGEVVEFVHPGAQVDLVVGDLVSYRIITLPNGRVVVDRPVKRPQ